MGSRCGCGTEVNHASQYLGCIECGAACCPACAVPLESVTYCRGCAGSLLGVAVRTNGDFELH